MDRNNERAKVNKYCAHKTIIVVLRQLRREMLLEKLMYNKGKRQRGIKATRHKGIKGNTNTASSHKLQANAGPHLIASPEYKEPETRNLEPETIRSCEEANCREPRNEVTEN